MAIEMANGEILDADTQATLEDLKKQGHEIDGEAKPDAPKAQEAPKAEPAKPAEAPKPEAEKPKEEEPKDEDDTEADKPKVERSVKAVPVRKYNELRHELQEAKKQLAEKQQAEKPNASKPDQALTPEITDAVKAVAAKHKIEDPSLLLDLANTIAEAVGRKAAIPADILLAAEQWKKSTAAQQEELGFQNDFATVSKEFPQIADHKDKLKELAYTEGNEKTPLRSLAIEYMHDSGMFESGRKTAEHATATGTGRGAEVIDFDNVTDEQFKGMPPDAQAKFIQYQLDKENKAAEG
jgi:hypothetical protein